MRSGMSYFNEEKYERKGIEEKDDGPEKYFGRGVTYPFMTPTISPDDSAYKAACKLQQIWDESIS